MKQQNSQRLRIPSRAALVTAVVSMAVAADPLRIFPLDVEALAFIALLVSFGWAIVSMIPRRSGT